MIASPAPRTDAAAAASVRRRLRALTTTAVVAAIFCIGFVWSVSIGTEPIGLGDIFHGMLLTSSSTDDVPQKVLVEEGSLEAAQFAIEAMTDQDELVGDA